MSDSAALWAVTHQAPLSMGFSKQEYWCGLPCPPPGDLLYPRSNPHLLCLLHWQVDSLPPCHLGSPYINMMLFDKRQEEETTKSQQAVTLCSGTQQRDCRNHHSTPNTPSHHEAKNPRANFEQTSSISIYSSHLYRTFQFAKSF